MLYHPVKKRIVINQPAVEGSDELGTQPPLLRRVLKARRISGVQELDRSLSCLPAPELLSGMDAMVSVLEAAIVNNENLLVIGDYDADGATASALAVRGLRAMGLKRVGYLVPDRFEYGYGLTPPLVQLAAGQSPDILLTVDNGISSIDGVAEANRLGLRVLVTDHHLPGASLPEAAAIVNPHLPGQTFPGMCLAGVGVMFFVLIALRRRLRDSGWFKETGRKEPNLAGLLDLVALGTVADLVPLDHVNRILVFQGLQRIRAGQAQPGMMALLKVAGRQPENLGAAQLGFNVAPRLNAAGRLDDMSLGIECLLTDDFENALELAHLLNDKNQDRQLIEDDMREVAIAQVAELQKRDNSAYGYCLFHEDWHQGVVGLIASRVKERVHRPVIAFAPANQDSDEIKGSARSIAGIHIRDVLTDVATRHPELLSKFGGHAMAAGLSLKREQLDAFKAAFQEEVRRHAGDMDLEPTVHSDGSLNDADFSLETAELLQSQGPWGQGFPEPLFDGDFEVLDCRIMKDQHLKWKLKAPGGSRPLEAVAFRVENPAAWLGLQNLRMAYKLDANEFQGRRSLQLMIEYMQAVHD